MTLVTLDNLNDEELLATRLCDLPIAIKGTWIETCINELYQNLAAKGIVFRPPCYLSDEWLTPDQEPVVGIPFFLAHPNLIKLEKKMMLDVEGATPDWCLKILRHETGHAINYAYRLYRRKSWKEIFGEFTTKYADVYRFRPYSKSFVRHLEDYYAQYHPDEDFAETFAVWLTPGLDWNRDYLGWPALAKLRYVNTLMTEIANKEPAVQQGKKYWQVQKIKKTLKAYYEQKRRFHAEDFPDFHDANLRQIFAEKASSQATLPTAASVMIKHRKALFDNLPKWTGEKKYVVDGLFHKITNRCRDLGLVCADTESVVILKVAIYMTTLLMNYMYTGRWRGEKWQKT